MQDGIESFEITDFDMESALNPGNRPRHRQSKKQTIYGVFADSDSEEDEQTVQRVGRKAGKKTVTEGIDFISGGVKKTAAENEDLPGPGHGDREASVLERGSFPQQFGSNSTTQTQQQQQQQPSHFKTYKKNEDQHFGKWEKHTKGFGEKMLKKMGYEEGKGLGKTGQGLVAPVEAFKRKGKGALGYHGPERDRPLAGRGGGQAGPGPGGLTRHQAIDSEEEEEAEFKQQMEQWKKEPAASAKAGPKYVYKTVEEIKKEGVGKRPRQKGGELSQVPVIDLTGPQRRVLTGYQQLQQRHTAPPPGGAVPTPDPGSQERPAAFAMPELQRNIQILVEQTEEEIIQTDRQLRYQEDLRITLAHEEQKLSEIVEREAGQLHRTKEVLQLVRECEERTAVGCADPMTLEECADLFQRLQQDHRQEYQLYQLSHLAVPVVFPKIKQHLSGWKPLERSDYGLEVFRRWKAILDNPESVVRLEDGQSMTVYDRLLWEVWMPSIRWAVASWNVKNCEPLIQLLESWLPLLKPWLVANLLDQLVLPRLQAAVEQWNPLTDTQRLDLWLQPWLPLAAHRLEPLYPTIRHKLGSALVDWNPVDTSAKVILQPWKQVFSQGAMDAFIARHILPKLASCLQQFVVNPHQQHLELFRAVTSWKDMVSVASLAQLMDKYFFPKWIHALCAWLSNNPNYAEVTKWFLGWKNLFGQVSKQLLDYPTVKDKFEEALSIMNKAVSGTGGSLQPGAQENVAYLTQTQTQTLPQGRRAHPAPAPIPIPNPAAAALRGPTASNIPKSFKEMLEKVAEEKNIVFLPTNQSYQGKLVYSFGNHKIYLERGVAFVQQGQLWTPMSLQRLIEYTR